MKFSMTGQKKVTFKTRDCLIEVSEWAGLTVSFTIHYYVATIQISAGSQTTEIVAIKTNLY